MKTTVQEQKDNCTPDGLPAPHGGELVNLIVSPERASELKLKSREWPSWNLTSRQLCDLELLLDGGFSPLRGFMSRADYESTCGRMRLADGTIWPIPIILDVPDTFARTIGSGSQVALRDPEGAMLAVLHVEELWQPDQREEAVAIYGTMNPLHPGANYLLNRTKIWYVGGRLEGIRRPTHYDFRALRLNPSQLRAEFGRLGWRRVIGFQTKSLMHRADQELTLRLANELKANLLIHSWVGATEPGQMEYYMRIRCYEALLSKYPRDTAKLALLPLAVRRAGPREAVGHAIICKNYGCSHFITGRDHASPGDESRERYYTPYAAQELVETHQKAIGISVVHCRRMVYLEDQNIYVPEDRVPGGARALNISEKELRVRLSTGKEIPPWFTFPEIERELRRSYPPQRRQGFTIFFTGLSCSGKSTLANVLFTKSLEIGNRPVTLLDGDIVRKHLSSELGFSREHRDTNIRRIGFVASEITKHGGIAICAPIAPFDEVRKEVRAMIELYGGFILVYLATPLEVCEKRDSKGLYARARAGLVKQFTGISDPYEAPEDADVILNTSELAPEEASRKIFEHLEREGFVVANGRRCKADLNGVL